MDKKLKNRILIQPIFEGGTIYYEASVPSWGASVVGGGDDPIGALEDLMGPVEDFLTGEEEVPEDDLTPEWVDFSGKVTLRLPKDLHFKAFKYAQLSNQSLNNLLQVAVASYLASAEKPFVQEHYYLVHGGSLELGSAGRAPIDSPEKSKPKICAG